MKKVLKKKTVSVNFSSALFSRWIPCSLKMGPIDCPETSVRKYKSALCNNSLERGSHMTIWRSTPWFDSAWSGSELSGLAGSISAFHMQI